MRHYSWRSDTGAADRRCGDTQVSLATWSVQSLNDVHRLPHGAAEIVEAVRRGILTPHEARRYLGLPPLSVTGPMGGEPGLPRHIAQAFPQLEEPVRAFGVRHPFRWYLARLAISVCWRVCAVGVAIFVAQSGYAPPLAAVAVILVLGTVARLWRRQGLLGQAWRWGVLSVALAWIGPVWSSEYGHIVAFALIAAGVTGILSTPRPR